ncbi:zinc finger CCHC domain-containing protein 7 [Gracilinanus agilis]|uniref:zinc finger CCHC domain-containing protein 7 n=1 Tax=Gracilinanus agilis TaxID=191870 RepID=UPI001CFEDE21|nr:zinc finger CCHC domain-containing protein 7 [Gracilinanus agilis]
MFGGYEDIEAYEDDLYRDESSSELSVDSEVEFQLYGQVHYAQDLGDVTKEENNEEKGSEDPESLNIKKTSQKNLIVLSDTDVIQISDGSEVISLSDEDSVYRCKRKNRGNQVLESHDEQSDELSRKKYKRANKKSKRGERSNVIQEVMVIEDSSNEEKEITVSESGESDVESWMLLGCEVDDKDDDNILLNLVGCETSVGEGKSDVNWFISDKDLEAQISNNRSSGKRNIRYYSADKNVICRNCEKRGHLSKNCPVPQKIRACCLCAERGHLQYDCPSRFCLDCSLPAYYSHKCLERPSWKKHCERCDMKGHYADTCPEIWRQYHLTTKPGPPKRPKTYLGRSTLVYCYNCSRKGHYGYECTERRMLSGTFPTVPFIYYYDKEHDIRDQEQRIQWKVEELQKNGDFPRPIKRPHMEPTNRSPYHGIKKRHTVEEDHRWHQEKKHLRRTKMSNWSSRSQEKKYRRDVQRWYDGDEDFIRGPRNHSSSHRSSHLAHHHQKMSGRELSKRGKWEKHKKGEGKRVDEEESLFLIKQRKKKSKLKHNC